MIFISHRAPPISAFCARPVMMASELRAVRQEPGLKGEADGLKDRDVPASGRLKHGPDIGVERGPPRGSKAVGDLAEHNAGPERLFGAIVGWRAARLVMNTNRFWRKRLMIRWSFCPAAVIGVIASKMSSLF